MRVCAPPDHMPSSSRAGEGFENRIAEILARELGAELTYEWSAASAYGVHHNLRAGTCDVMLGVAESASGLLNTVPYVRVPFAFVFRNDGAFAADSLLDPALSELTIAVPPNGLLHKVLEDLGLAHALELIPTERTRGGAEGQTALVEAVLQGRADVALMIASDASVFTSRHPDRLDLQVATPEIVPPLSQMFQVATIGVRPGDEALRDRLNVALATAWEDIQSVFGEFGIPTLAVPRPQPPLPVTPEPVRIGVVLPIPTPNPLPSDAIARAAAIGADTADDLIGRRAERSRAPLRVFMASAPTREAAVRAADRLRSTEGIHALVGGLGDGQAVALADWSQHEGVLFMNIGSPDQELRSAACGATSFHVEASDAMYLDATFAWYAADGRTRWYVVHEESPVGRARLALARKRLDRKPDLELVGAAAVPAGFASYADAIDDILATSPQGVLLLIEAEEQELFLSQIDREDANFVITGRTPPRMQTREFLVRLRQSAPHAALNPRPSLWETTLTASGAEAFNASFISRSGEPADPAGWAAYAAIVIAYETAVAAGRDDPRAMVDYLENEATFDVHKGVSVHFRPGTHQLAQPLYMVAADPDASYGLEVTSRVALGRLVGTVPDLPAQRSALDVLGVSSAESTCTPR